jgi:hypothetical protein
MLTLIHNVVPLFMRQSIDAIQQRNRFRSFSSCEQMRLKRPPGSILSGNKRLDTVIAQQREQFVFLIEAHTRLSSDKTPQIAPSLRSPHLRSTDGLSLT